MGARLDAIIATLKPKHGVHHTTLSPADYWAFHAERGYPPFLGKGDTAFVYRGRPIIRGPHYTGPGVLWSQYGTVLHPHELGATP